MRPLFPLHSEGEGTGEGGGLSLLPSVGTFGKTNIAVTCWPAAAYVGIRPSAGPPVFNILNTATPTGRLPYNSPKKAVLVSC